MKKIAAFLALVVSLSNFSVSAQSGVIKGNVVDEQQTPVGAATVSLVYAKDSSLVKTTLANAQGNFQLDSLVDAQYKILLTGSGSQRWYSPILSVSATNSSINLKSVVLPKAVLSLTGVTVTGRKSLIEQKIDRTVVNVDAAISNAGTTALEVLEKSPGISIDKEGNISLKGKSGVLVLIDGRPSQLGSADLANLLRSMPSSGMDQIEIMTNPPAKYDAAGNAGIINIKTKKNKQLGYNGSVTVGFGKGVYYRHNEGVVFNYRKNKLNLFFNGSHNYNKRDEQLSIQRNFLNPATKEVLYSFDQRGRMSNSRVSYNAKAGFDYSFNPKTSVGLAASGFSSPNTFANFTTTNKHVGNILEEGTRSTAANKEQFKNGSLNLNFRRVLDTTGREITADLDYLTYKGNGAMKLVSDYFSAAGLKKGRSDTLVGSLPQLITIYSGKVDYVHPLKNKRRFEAGIKTSIVATDNNALYDTATNGGLQRDQSRSNHFLYEENINAAYVNLSMPLGEKWNGQFGLRAENTTAKGTQRTTREVFNRSYTQLFPTTFLQYSMNAKNNFGINYGRRINRPNYESLNPFIEFLDRYTFQQGNPDLKPQFSHNMELSHTYNNILTTTLNYTKTTDIIQQVIEQNEEKSETFVRQANIANQRQYGISVNAGVPLNKWWTSNMYVNVFNNRFEGVVDGTKVNIGGTTAMLNGSQQFKLGKTTSAEVSGWFRSASIEGVMKIGSMGMIALGFSQQVFKNTGTFRFAFRDVLNIQKVHGESKYGTIDAVFQNKQDTRVASVGFTYRFSKGKMAGVTKRRAGSANEEQNRVGGGNNN